MCGIAGVLGLGVDLGGPDRDELRGMTAVLHHRGPDGRRHVWMPRCALGNTRLQILDLSERGALPMPNAEGSVWIAYNGEVTNFRALEREHRLRERFPFRSTTDTETLLYLYEALGIDFVRQLTGQFAFALHDRRLGKTWLVRDFFGIRPLFLMKTPERLYFASEIKSFLGLEAFRKDLDLEGLHHYLTLGYIPGKHTPFQQIEELQGAHLVEVDHAGGRVHERRYDEILYRPRAVPDERALAEELHLYMRDSVRRNLVSDAPLGLTLSGGFDTSSILALTREVVGPDAPIHTYSIAMGEASFDESRYQRLMSRVARTTHHEIRVGPHEVLGALERQMAYMDEPTADGAAIPSFLMAERAKQDVKVLLSGEGGDETFTAYETYRAWKVRRYYRRFVPRAGRRLIRHAVHALPSDYRKLSLDFMAKRFTDGAELDVAQAHIHWRFTLTDADKAALMPDHRPSETTGALFARHFDAYRFPHELDRLSALDLETYLIGDLMVKNDRTLMAHSVEARFPYLDRTLFERMAQVPADLRLKGMRGRHMQKRAMEGRVPREIVGRKNMGLELPHSLWLMREMRPLADRLFEPSRVARLGFLSPRHVTSLWQEHLAGRRDNGRALWSIATLLTWHGLFVEGSSFRGHLTPPPHAGMDVDPTLPAPPSA